MLRITGLRCSVGRAKVFEIFCREQLLTNMSLRELTHTERRRAMSQLFKKLSEEQLLALKQQASIEQLRQEALERAAAYFKPLTTYELFAREQKDNPAFTGASPREKEVKLLQIYESLPENARKAIERRTEQYNNAHSMKPATPALPVIPVRKKPTAPASGSSSKTKKKAPKSRRTARRKLAEEAAMDEVTETSADGSLAIKKRASQRGVGSPYAVFVKEHMASLHHLAPKDRMRVIGERWRSLTKEERQLRLQAGKAKLAEVLAAKAQAAETAESKSPQTLSGAAPAALSSPPAPPTNAADSTSTQAASTITSSLTQQQPTPPAGVNSSAAVTASPRPPLASQPITF
ncbi:hypothetical protein conserved [Leishmania donovani]|uniref:Uncharacterized protein n=3 Tax=Leishmania donovani species complex TaxID=38574 RepID=A4IDZ6_LEIIN|nr:conserved hypothetical protein [Leishmania infantum JPCM5]XP_003865721.1 hypothetical protein, conserved [Leishmania donovani]CAC9552776.1 hypothetical_protein_-_conserved [Leishmania infantum]AYU83967.1 hypothetical protein LdCL_360068300 [Leishmania donovani]TPP48711.1 hypothetical protein CGC21_15305 [Leishmania donovani]TPP49572.1 hypothetical protein CGC20_19245 [Leishmania donovani]CAJ1993984.1 hypothetical protein conserved [Leishmania donovani]|eukprot:XP_001469965.1 conserved hypothetical protein [Leishmania infantum JPCM5]